MPPMKTRARVEYFLTREARKGNVISDGNSMDTYKF